MRGEVVDIISSCPHYKHKGLNSLFNPQTFKSQSVLSWLRRLAGATAVFALLAPLSAHATGPASFSLTPSSGSYVVGSDLTVTVYETSSDPVNAVEADLTYDQTKLQYSSVDMSQTAFTLGVPNSNGNGSVKLIAAEQAGSGYTGQQVVGSVTFKVLASSGTTSINIANTSQLVLYPGGTAVSGVTFSGGTYTLTAATVPTSPTTPTTPTTPASGSSSSSHSSKSTTTTSGTGSTSTTTTTTPVTPAPSATPTPTYAVAVKVVDGSGKPIMGAVVTIGATASTTDSTGVANFANLAAGSHSVEVTDNGKTKTDHIAVASSGALPAVQQFQLTLAATSNAHLIDYGLVLLLLIVVIGSGLGLSRVLAGHDRNLAMTPGVTTTPSAPIDTTTPPPVVNPDVPPSQVFYPTTGSTPIMPSDVPKEGPPDAK